MPWEWTEKLQKVAKEEGITLFSSPFDFSSIEFLEKLNMPAYKIASAEMIDLPLVRRVAQTGKPIIMSTGGATLEQINEAVAIMIEENVKDLAILKCTSEYPAPPSRINLKTIQNLKESNIDEANRNLNKLNELLKNQIQNIESVDRNDLTVNLKELISDITSSQEKYATSYGKNQTIRSDSIKRKERIKNIDQELENWKDLKLNSEKMILELTERRKKIEKELEENQKNPEKIAINKGQNLQNLENTKKQN